MASSSNTLKELFITIGLKGEDKTEAGLKRMAAAQKKRAEAIASANSKARNDLKIISQRIKLVGRLFKVTTRDGQRRAKTFVVSIMRISAGFKKVASSVRFATRQLARFGRGVNKVKRSVFSLKNILTGAVAGFALFRAAQFGVGLVRTGVAAAANNQQGAAFLGRNIARGGGGPADAARVERVIQEMSDQFGQNTDNLRNALASTGITNTDDLIRVARIGATQAALDPSRSLKTFIDLARDVGTTGAVGPALATIAPALLELSTEERKTRGLALAAAATKELGKGFKDDLNTTFRRWANFLDDRALEFGRPIAKGLQFLLNNVRKLNVNFAPFGKVIGAVLRSLGDWLGANPGQTVKDINKTIKDVAHSILSSVIEILDIVKFLFGMDSLTGKVLGEGGSFGDRLEKLLGWWDGVKKFFKDYRLKVDIFGGTFGGEGVQGSAPGSGHRARGRIDSSGVLHGLGTSLGTGLGTTRRKTVGSTTDNRTTDNSAVTINQTNNITTSQPVTTIKHQLASVMPNSTATGRIS